MALEIGSIEPGKLADLVLWKPAFFGAKPEMVVKGGFIAWSAMGDPNALDPDAAAGIVPANVWEFRRGNFRDCNYVCIAGRRDRRIARKVGVEENGSAGEQVPSHWKERHGAQ